MKKLQNLRALAAVATVAAPVSLAAQAAARRPNLVLIMCDQFRGSAIGCLGEEAVQTPNLDRLAQEGVMLTNAVSCYPVSSPARAMMMTGLYPEKNKVTGNCNSNDAPYGVELQEDARCWSDVLHQEGYSTAYFGKWHLDSPREPYIDCYNNRGANKWNEWCPPERRHGFDTWVSYGTYDRHMHPLYWDTHSPREGYYYVDKWGPEYEADLAIGYLRRHAADSRPFAMVVSMNPPHTVVDQCPEQYRRLYSRLNVDSIAARPDVPAADTRMGAFFRRTLADYYACITGVDAQIGRILSEIKAQGLEENTLIVFTSDHGACMGLHGIEGKNTYYEEAMRIPMIVKWTGKLRPRRDTTLMMSNADLYATMLTLMGLRKNIPAEVESRNFARQVAGAARPPRNQWQPYFFINPANAGTGFRGLRTPTHTFAIHAKNGVVDSLTLFDRRADPYELHNIAAQNPQLTRRLTRRLLRFLRKSGDSFAQFIKNPR